MRLLILGGTGFLGRYLTTSAVARGHDVSLFHRGKTNPDLFPELEHLYGERDGNLAALKGRYWDAVIDTSGYLPRVVRASADLLADVVEHYTFISTMMVYAGIYEPQVGLLDESATLLKLDDPTSEQLTEQSYGPLKALCEQVVEEIFPGRSLSIRPCIIVGPHDPTDRFAYWVNRIAAGGNVVALGSPTRSIQWIDVRDLAEWTLQMIEGRTAGVYNATSPRIMFGEVLTAMDSVSQAGASINWVDEHFLREANIIPENQIPYRFPFWTPPTLPGFFTINGAKAATQGLTLRPLTMTVQDTLEWIRTNPPEFGRLRRLTSEEERQILAKWNQNGVFN